ncbi:DUF420 domain-containing protein [Kamptonema cortianum]|uniref:DUF420 domain-containing protein n=1 Tax=Geitlerinema calcuttense NRMC-F 0142 TaxID=2922238 RepID=A0ABT7M0Y5_9CYAN|nr:MULTISPECIES: DUF420 domain-containing protein [Cyanophyceae]MDK3161794.1 DUF420 domain-containing protein [Kamptonema cortianum]MDL5054366.1 DUF420 domain-containing protein [Oscillatoria laete-virens NRMC-F 0139]MDL5057911.1 DUF420 domain-containing protein [Geitlerinema calcuttense NRMC-F 0142]
MDLSIFPTINASLNALTTILLGTGYILIKRGHKKAHGITMAAAFAVSAVFLGFYLFYHYMKEGNVTRYPLEDFSRTIYLTILTSHTILAMVVLPFIFALLYFAIKKNWDKHKKFARWVWPVWMYISVTGVVIYWMLYHYAGAGR